MPRTSNPRSRLQAELRDAQAIVRDTKKAANAAYEEATKAVRAEYESIVNPAKKKLDSIVIPAQKEYEQIVEPARAKYMAISTQHENERKAAIDAAEAQAAKLTDEAFERYNKSR